MKKMIDVISGKEDIKVKSLDSPNIITQELKWKNEDFLMFIDNNNLDVYHEPTENNWYFNIDGSFESSEIKSIVIRTQGQLSLPSYTTASRPASQDEGSIIYDSTLKKCILYNGTAWVNLDGTALS